jgi:hypothetical protein
VIEQRVSIEKLKKGIEQIALKRFSMEILQKQYVDNFKSVI